MTKIKITEQTLTNLKEIFDTNKDIQPEFRNSLLDSMKQVSDKDDVAMILSLIAISSPEIEDNQAFKNICNEFDITDTNIKHNPTVKKIVDIVMPELQPILDNLQTNLTQKKKR